MSFIRAQVPGNEQHLINGKVTSLQTVVDLTDKSPYKVFYEIEPAPEDRGLIQRVIDNQAFYNLILTWRESILQSCPNAVKFLYAGPYMIPSGDRLVIPSHVGHYTTPEPRDVGPLHTEKKFAASMIASYKDALPGHILRRGIITRLPETVGQLPIHKHSSPPHIPEVERGRLFTEFQYAIAVENCNYNNWMTEKLFDCFVARTIPIYWGCPNLGEYFNLDGIFQVANYEDVVRVLESITPDTYREKAAAIEDNFNRCVDVYCKPYRLGVILEANL